MRLSVKRVGLNAARPNFFDLPSTQRRTSPAHYISQGEATAFFLGLYEEYEKHRDAGIEAARERKMAGCPHYAVCNGGCPHDCYTAMRYDPAYREDAAARAS